jgi:hypothetical protein
MGLINRKLLYKEISFVEVREASRQWYGPLPKTYSKLKKRKAALKIL